MSDSIPYMFEIVIDVLPFPKESTKKKSQRKQVKIQYFSFVNAISE